MKRRTERSEYGLAGPRRRRTEPIGIRGPGLAMLAAAHCTYGGGGSARPGRGDADPGGGGPRRADGGDLRDRGQPHRACPRPHRPRDPRPGRLCGRARPGIGRSLSAPAGGGAVRTGRGGGTAGHAVRRHREGLHLPAGTDPGGARLGPDPDPQRGLRRLRGTYRPRPAIRAIPWVAALVGLVRAVARREPLPGYAIEAGPAGTGATGAAIAATPEPFRIVETWRGARFQAHVVEVRRAVAGAADLAGTVPGLAGRIAAAWLAGPGTGPGGGRLAVVVSERAEDAP